MWYTVGLLLCTILKHTGILLLYFASLGMSLQSIILNPQERKQPITTQRKSTKIYFQRNKENQFLYHRTLMIKQPFEYSIGI